MSTALESDSLSFSRKKDESWGVFRAQLHGMVTGLVRENEPLSEHTSFGIGGPADYFVCPATEAEMASVIHLVHVHRLPLMVIGRGTNLLVGDRGVRGVVLDVSLACRRLEEVSGGVLAGSGISVTELLDFGVQHHLGGLEFMAGIPGSVGGAIKVNAGAWGRSLGELVRRIWGYDTTGQQVILASADLQFEYRRSSLPADMIITHGELVLVKKPGELIQTEIEQFRRRRRHQPTGQKSAGSVFKNPPGLPAGKLIEEAGCKGLRVDGVEVSPQHANFIVNHGDASAAAVRDLIARVRQRVKERFGILLELEIIQVGEE